MASGPLAHPGPGYPQGGPGAPAVKLYQPPPVAPPPTGTAGIMVVVIILICHLSCFYQVLLDSFANTLIQMFIPI